jgi:hypothetical protein
MTSNKGFCIEKTTQIRQISKETKYKIAIFL